MPVRLTTQNRNHGTLKDNHKTHQYASRIEDDVTEDQVIKESLKHQVKVACVCMQYLLPYLAITSKSETSLQICVTSHVSTEKPQV